MAILPLYSLVSFLLALCGLPALAMRLQEGAETWSMGSELLSSVDMEFDGRYKVIGRLGGADWPATGVQGYKNVRYLGKGAFGETFLAIDQTSGQEVAIKFFYRQGMRGAVILLNMQNANMREKEMLREAGAECTTPGNIIAARSSVPQGGDRFAKCLENHVKDPRHAHLILQVAGTQSLEQWVQKKRSRLSGDDVSRIAKMMLEGLAQMEGKYVHRDIKPANLMIYEEGGQAYLRFIDFGLVVSHGQRGGVAGTPMFMPPEFWPVVPRSPTFTSDFDVYSTGETLYWLLCGETFHEKAFNLVGGRGEVEIQKALVERDPKKMCSPKPAFTSLYNLVVDKMLQASPAKRSKASILLADSIFNGVNTSKGDAKDAAATPAAPVQQEKPQREPAEKPVAPAEKPVAGQPDGDAGDLKKLDPRALPKQLPPVPAKINPKAQPVVAPNGYPKQLPPVPAKINPKAQPLVAPNGYPGGVAKKPNPKPPVVQVAPKPPVEFPGRPVAKGTPKPQDIDEKELVKKPAQKFPFDVIGDIADAPSEPSFMDKCHDSKEFWFQNVGGCCLQARYDPRRDAVCNRPCGPKVAYSKGRCENNCQATTAGSFVFHPSKFCCVATVWKDKCIYPDHMPSGEGWRWMAAEGL